MAYNITGVETFDNKRNKVTLDYGEVTFLLYKGECRQLHIGLTEAAAGRDTDVNAAGAGRKTGAGADARRELSDEEYAAIKADILVPRAKKRVLYFMKNADKTRHQIRQKLKEGFYPDDVIDEVMRFLDRYGFADDKQYAGNYVEELKGSRSRREIEAKLMQKGLKAADIRAELEAVSPEDEAAACERALRKKYPHGLPDDADPAERRKAYAYLARKGFSYETIETVTQEVSYGR